MPRDAPGGGVALLRAIRVLDALKVENDDQRTGINIIRKALQAPIRQIARSPWSLFVK